MTMIHYPHSRHSKYSTLPCAVIITLLLSRILSVAFTPPPLPALEPTNSLGKSLARSYQRRRCFPLYKCCGIRWIAVQQKWRGSWLLRDSKREGGATPSNVDMLERNNNATTSGTASDSSPIDEVDRNASATPASLPEDMDHDAKVALAQDAGILCSELEAEVASFTFAPAMTVNKFKTLQDRRVPVAIKYSGGGGFKRYFEEVAMMLKTRFPDVLIQREIVEVKSTRGEQVFEIRIDGKLVCAKRRGKAGVFLQMETVEQAVKKAKRRRRPGAVVYGDHETYRNVRSPAEPKPSDVGIRREDIES